MTVSVKKYMTALVASSVLALGLYGCGGGGGDGAQTGGMPTIDHGDGLFASPETSPLAMSSTDTLASIGGTNTIVAPLSAAIGLEYDAQGNLSVMVLPKGEPAYIESSTISDDQGTYTMVYVADGQRTEVEFRSIDWTGSQSEKMIDGVYYFAWDALAFPQGATPEYSWHFGWQVGDDYRGYATNGMLTPPDQLTSLGSATYEGELLADYWRTDDPSPGYFDNRGTVAGRIVLEADLAQGSISGQVDNIWIEDHGDAFSGNWVLLPDTNSIQIQMGTVDGNRFYAEWQGQGPSLSADQPHSMRGFEGSILGEFYGPNGEESGGVLNGQRDSTSHLINGRFGAERQ